MIANKALEFIANPWAYSALYFVLVLRSHTFTLRLRLIQIKCQRIFRKSGAFIPGVRPGQSTSHYVARILTRLTLFGASFLGIIAVCHSLSVH